MNNKALKTLFMFNGIFVFATSLLGPLYAVFVETISADILSISISWGIFLISTTGFLLLMRRWGDAIKEKEYLLMAGYLIRAIVWFIFPTITTFSTLIIAQVLLGLGESLGGPAYDAIFAEHLDNNKHIKEYTDWKLITNIVGGVGVMLGGLLVKEFGFSVLFYLMSLFSLISFIGIYIKPRSLL